MRTITKTITLPVDGSSTEFRLTKLDAFSGAMLMQILSRYQQTEKREGSGSSLPVSDLITRVFSTLPAAELRSVMVSCLNAVEVRLPAGWQPLMTGSDWGWPDLEHDTAVCLKLTFEVILWTLQGFFVESASNSPPGK